MITVAVTSPLPGRAEQLLGEDFDLRVHGGPLLATETEVASFIGSAHGAVTLLGNPVGEHVITSCPDLRVVGNVAVGYDNIDLDAARGGGVWVTNTPDVLTEATADLSWALILAVTRRLREAEQFLREGRFRAWELDLLLGTGLQDKTLGVVGYGRIGRAVARRAVAFGMRVAYTDREPFAKPEPAAEYLALDDLLGVSDVLSLHCPLTHETRHLLDRDRLRLMPEGAILINTARGPLVDEAALAEELEHGRLAGAGLDVYEFEPEVNPRLITRREVVLLPHVGSATVETRAAMAELAARNVIAVLRGEEAPTPVVRGRL